MYSRAARTFLAPNRDHANPGLGPGCYAPDAPVLVAGKIVGDDGYAPFASLTPRVSYFDELIVAGPAPGAYDAAAGVGAVRRRDAAALFGRSRTQRFDKCASLTPGPGSYRIQGVLHSPHRTHGAIVWKRKYVPPSVPAGRFAFGYQESPEGDLVPRKPPKRTVEEAPAHLASFVERAKHESRGCRFARGGERLSYKVNESPGPNRYNPVAGDKYLATKSNGSGPAVMTLSPCRRLTDEIVADSVKKGIPGPGAYDIKAPIADTIAQPRNRIRFGGQGKERAYINPELMKTPGPGAYYPEFADHPKPHSHKPQPFGSTTKRFDMQTAIKATQVPAVGSYDIDEVRRHRQSRIVLHTNLTSATQMDSIFRRVQNRAMYMSLRPAAFGSVADRFVEQRPTMIPGPGAYDVAAKKEDGPPATEIKLSLRGQADKRKEHNKLQKLLNRGPAQLLLGSIQLPTAKVHVPIFGTQTERFAQPDQDLPPPGAYDIANSFQVLKNKGRIENTGVLASQNKRELFPGTSGLISSDAAAAAAADFKGSVPGPGEYNPLLEERKEIRQTIGAFLSTGPRFGEKYERVPGPGAYLPPDYENGLVKKTFNITLGRHDGFGVA
ncbi:hypothetical protein HK105_207223 [Polyrhizophydium stewartii]|uniref:Sperm-tail PG-rich repeat-containing protein 2 n=1 Tax=Polyrhizophydium stewartii TaxID=2732419 RepID=A0ABR4N107_9FUNG